VTRLLNHHKKIGATAPLWGIYNYAKRENYKKTKGRIPSPERKEEASKGYGQEG